jgi:hypothetical protein
MSEASIFDLVCAGLEQRTSFNRLEARGTVRLALKQAGLDAAQVTAVQMRAVLEKILPGELRARGVDDPDGHCRALAALLAGRERSEDRGPASPEAVFARLAGD